MNDVFDPHAERSDVIHHEGDGYSLMIDVDRLDETAREHVGASLGRFCRGLLTRLSDDAGRFSVKTESIVVYTDALAGLRQVGAITTEAPTHGFCGRQPNILRLAP